MGKRLFEEPILFCFCGPAACGKSTICQELLARDSSLVLSISTTTRSPREGEVDGTHYYFTDNGEFEKRISDDAFLEHAHFGGCYYGTEKKNISRAKKVRADLLLDIDVQGVLQLKKIYQERLVTVFVFPPSIDVLIDRFKKRGTDSPERIAERLRIAETEIETLTQSGFSDYLLINDTLEESVASAQSLIAGERQRFVRLSCDTLAKMFKVS